MTAEDLATGDDEHWLRRNWREAMAWQYFVVCIADFIIFPIANGVLYAAYDKPYHEWHPLTLQGGGLYHMAMAAILGVAAWQRSQERIACFNGSNDFSSTDRTYDSVRPDDGKKSSRED